ncbi:glycoside hydrolase [Thraustotheca clavata]|uniref:Glycoside hydrolase n=1 Tax=Thraustotheca clavata TaxID=74557 RepID=A0A1W0A174_9STRA|nr:glycoside hydrolase [Thraustotheca clavata]
MELGSRVLVVGGKQGVVRFMGTTEFAQGDWVGVELDAPEGKNDGEINGVRYFQCEPNYGLFAKKSQVRLARTSATPPTHTTGTTSRLQQMREKRGSSSSLASVASSTSVKKTSPRTAENGRPTLTRRTSSTVPSSPSRRQPAPAPLNMPPSPTGSTRSTRSALSMDEQDILEHAHDKIEHLLHDIELKNERIVQLQTELETQKQSYEVELAKVHSAKRDEAKSDEYDAKAEYDEKVRELRDEGIALAAKMRKDFEIKVTKLEKGWEDKEATWQAQKEKQTNEMNAMQNELVGLRSRVTQFTTTEQSRTEEMAQLQAKVSAAIRKADTLSATIADLNDTVEMLTLEKETLEMDKEIAEERIEDFEMEVEKLKLAVEIAGSGDDAAMHLDLNSSSVHEENAKLRIALKALHDRFSDEKLDLTKSLKDATRQVAELSRYREEVEEITVKMAKLSHENEELKEMLDVASAYESMVESLTDKNLQLGERVADLEASVASLEALKDMSEEMEHQHDLLEKDLRAELAKLYDKCHEQAETLKTTQASLDDKERTITRFRELAHRNREEMTGLREKLRKEAGELETMKDTTQAVMSQTLSLRQALTNARSSMVEAARAKISADIARIESTWLRSLLPSAIFVETDDRTLRIRLLLDRLYGKVDVVFDRIVKNLSGLTSEVLSNTLEKERLAYEWRFGIDLLQLRLAIQRQQHSLCTSTGSKFQALLARLDVPLTILLETNVDGVITALGEEGGLTAGSDEQPSPVDRLLASIKDWLTTFPPSEEKATALIPAAYTKLQARSLAYTISLHCGCLFLREDTGPLELRVALWNAALQIARRADIDLDNNSNESNDDDVLPVVGGETLLLLQAYSKESLELMSSASETQLLSFKERLNALYKSVSKGSLTDACVLKTFDEVARHTPQWELRAEQIRSDLASASSLMQSLEETTEICHTLHARVKELEKSESQSRIIVQKLEQDVARLSSDLAIETATTTKLTSQLQQERTQFDQMLTEQNKERSNLETSNRQLRKQMRRNSEMITPTKAPKDLVPSGVPPAQVQALEQALVEMHASMQRLRQEIALERLHQAVAPLPPVAPLTKLTTCLKDISSVESQILAQSSLPKLYSVGSSTPTDSAIAPLAKQVSALKEKIVQVATQEAWSNDIVSALKANEVEFSGRSVESVNGISPQRIGRLRFHDSGDCTRVVKVILSAAEMQLLSKALA